MNKDVEQLNDTVWARLAPSKLHGIGVFAIRDIPKNTVITEYRVFSTYKELYRIPVKDFNEILKPIRELILDRTIFSKQLSKEYLKFISPNSEACLMSFMNHSSNPNSNRCVTIKDIKEGEEITEDFIDLARENDIHELTAKHMSSFIKQ